MLGQMVQLPSDLGVLEDAQVGAKLRGPVRRWAPCQRASTAARRPLGHEATSSCPSTFAFRSASWLQLAVARSRSGHAPHSGEGVGKDVFKKNV